MKILVLYDAGSTFTGTVREHINSFALHSRHQVLYSPATNGKRCRFDLSQFDAIVIHYSVRLCYDWHISSDFASKIAEAMATKLLLIQDEYDNTALARQWIRNLGINIVFTCVPEEYIKTVYPPRELPSVRFIQTLTGWVPSEFEVDRELRPLGDRPNWISYRARDLPPWYGDLAREKTAIGRGMKEECIRRGVPCDIEWTEDKRIYGDAWPEFIQQSRTTLGSESGSNVFDEEGRIRAAIQADLEQDPDLSYSELHERHIGVEDGRIKMNQVSPRIFEAAALGTGLVLFRGKYSDVVQPGEHFIPLEKDFSNVDEVFSQLADVDSMSEMAKRARADVIESGRFSYRSFVAEVDQALEDSVGGAGNSIPIFKILEDLNPAEEISVVKILRRVASDLRFVLESQWKEAKKDPKRALRALLFRCQVFLRSLILLPVRILYKLGVRRPGWMKRNR